MFLAYDANCNVDQKALFSPMSGEEWVHNKLRRMVQCKLPPNKSQHYNIRAIRIIMTTTYSLR